MGRLGFNLVGQKDMEKAPQTEVTAEKKMPVVETVVVVDKLQNERNENSEESCLRAEIQAKNLTISKLRALSICLGLGLIFVIGFVLCFTLPQQCSQPQDSDAVMQMIQDKYHLNEDEASLISNFLGAREDRPEAARLEMQADAKMMMNVNCAAVISELEQLQNDKTILEKQLSAQKSKFEERDADTMRKFDMLQDGYVTLQTEKEALATEFAAKDQVMHAEIVKLQDERTDFQKKVEKLQDERTDFQKKVEKLQDERTDFQTKIEKLQEERTDLEKKIEAGNKKLQQLQQRSVRRQQELALRTTTQQPSRGLFGDGQLKKFNDLVKDIETGDVLYDLNSFLKRTDEVFRL